MFKSIAFGALASLLAVYYGWTARPTGEGVALATTQTVIATAISVLNSRLCPLGLHALGELSPMKSSHQIELTAGIFLLLAIAALIFLAVQATDRGVVSGGGYEIRASFTNIGGLKPRAKVAMGGK